MLHRRALPLIVAAPAAMAAAIPAAMAMPAPLGIWNWKVTRNGDVLGTHTVQITQRGTAHVAESNVNVVPRLLGIVMYRFEHRYTEVTQQGRFVSVESRLNRNGRIVTVNARAEADGVHAEGSEGAMLLPPGSAPLSWWEPDRLGGATPILGTTTGRLMELRWLRVSRPDGGFAWRSTGEVEAECGFGPQGVWDAFSTKGEDGVTVVYVRA